MKFKHLRLVPDGTNIPFMHYRKWSFGLSVILLVLSLAGWASRASTSASISPVAR